MEVEVAEENILERARKIRMLVIDVDGILTDGRIIYDNFGDELKFFDVKDGFGLYLLHKAGIPAVIISARKSRAVVRRAKEMRVRKFYRNSTNKVKSYEKVLKKFGIADENVCYVGDDLLDLSVMKRVGLAVSVPDGIEEVKTAAHYITQKNGGRGAVREIVDIILKAQGKWEQLAGQFV
jgi:3-deoxy-D-manno-octulosonate 8-phosphate phosphatase (KDO 8-P phosphatase)